MKRRAFDDRVVVWAVRYCMGRMTYVSGECATWLVRHWHMLSAETRDCIRRIVADHDLQDWDFVFWIERGAGRSIRFAPIGHPHHVCQIDHITFSGGCAILISGEIQN